jgi:hypothetical protein
MAARKKNTAVTRFDLFQAEEARLRRTVWSRAIIRARELDQQYKEKGRPSQEQIDADLQQLTGLLRSPSACELEKEANLAEAKKMVQGLSDDNKRRLLWWLSDLMPEALV